MAGRSTVYTRAANAVVISPSGKLLVLIGSEWPERPERSLKPDLVGGTIVPNETVETGLVREIQEETGLEVMTDSMQLVFQNTMPAAYQPGFWLNHYFLVCSRSEDVRLSDEHSDWRWVDYEQFVAEPWRVSQRIVVDFLHEQNILRQYVDEASR